MLTPGKLPEQADGEQGKGARPPAVLTAAGSVKLHPGTAAAAGPSLPSAAKSSG